MQRPRPAEIPDQPGAYMYRDRHGQVMYVGKAKSLRKRVSSYFVKDIAARTAAMLDASETVEWIVTDNEVEAFLLEYALIKEHRPRFNIRLRDDKSYPYLAITRSDEWPRARVMRGKKRKGTEYFGPYAHAYAVRNTLDLLLKSLPIRTCSDAVFRRQELRGRPCILYDIEKCSGPCVGLVEPDTYAEYVDGVAKFFDGDSDAIVAGVESKMTGAAERQEYELAARFRDQLFDLQKALERQEVVSPRAENFDLIALDDDELEASIQVLRVRKGRIVGRLGVVVDKVEDLEAGQLIATMMRDLYSEGDPPPKEVLVQELPDDADVVAEWLTERRDGAAVSLRVPRRGSKRRLMETANANAKEAFVRHRLKRQSDHNARAQDLRSLQDALGLPEPPLRIEAYDISTIQGTNTVGSMVVLEDGLPKRSQYRRFRVRGVEGQDDFASMEEVVRRRFQAYLKEREKPVSDRGKFSYPPSLILIDGGPGQLGRAVKVLEHLDLEIPVIGLAKRMEEVYTPGQPEPLVLARDEPALHLLQRVRDEAHRFAITYHRQIRGKRMVDSVLDEIEGIGPSRKKLLLKSFGSLKKIREADVDDLAEIVPETVAKNLYAALHGGPA